MSTEQSPADPRHNITAQELARDVRNLHLPARDLVATDEECAALYAPGVYEQLLKASGSPAGPLAPAPPTPEAQTLAQLRAKLAQGALTAARRLAPALRGTLSYPVALLELAEAQRQAGQEDAARRTLRTAQRRSRHLYEGDIKNGYPRAYYLTLIAEAQVQLHDPASAANTLASITPEQQRQEAMQRVRLV